MTVGGTALEAEGRLQAQIPRVFWEIRQIPSSNGNTATAEQQSTAATTTWHRVGMAEHGAPVSVRLSLGRRAQRIAVWTEVRFHLLLNALGMVSHEAAAVEREVHPTQWPHVAIVVSIEHFVHRCRNSFEYPLARRAGRSVSESFAMGFTAKLAALLYPGARRDQINSKDPEASTS